MAEEKTLHSTASEQRVKTLEEDHKHLENRWICQTAAIPHRYTKAPFSCYLQIYSPWKYIELLKDDPVQSTYMHFYDRIQVLDNHLTQVEQSDQALQKFSKWGESFLSSLHSSSHVDITDLQPFTDDVKVYFAMRSSPRFLRVCCFRQFWFAVFFSSSGEERNAAETKCRTTGSSTADQRLVWCLRACCGPTASG